MASRGNAVVNEPSAINTLEISEQIAMVEKVDVSIASNLQSSQPIAMMEKNGDSCNGMSMQRPGGCVALFLFGALVIAGLVAIVVFQAKILKALQKNGKKK